MYDCSKNLFCQSNDPGYPSLQSFHPSRGGSLRVCWDLQMISHLGLQRIKVEALLLMKQDYMEVHYHNRTRQRLLSEGRMTFYVKLKESFQSLSSQSEKRSSWVHLLHQALKSSSFNLVCLLY